MSPIIIHTQAQAQAELERQRAMSIARIRLRNQRMNDDPEYRRRFYLAKLEKQMQKRNNKRNMIESDSHRDDVEKDADRLAKVRKIMREKQTGDYAQDREDLADRVKLRYCSYKLLMLISCRIAELDAQFAYLQVRERDWPTPLPDAKPLYKKFVTHTYDLARNIVCACCSCISHDINEFVIVPPSYDPLRQLTVSDDIHIPFDISCGIDILDHSRIVIDKLGITEDKQILLCRSCHDQLSKEHQPSESVANFLWIGPVPKELLDLTWIEELLIARIHVCGSIVRLGQRHNTSSFFGIKGHVVFIPQDTTRLIDLLPISTASLSDIVKVVWTGKTVPDKSHLKSRFTVRKQRVYDALQWLVKNHEEYKKHVVINDEMMSAWQETFIAVELLDNIGHVSDPAVEDASRDGFAMNNDNNFETTGDLPFTSSGVVDVNNIAEVPDVSTLNRLAQLKNDITVNVVTGSKILNQYDCESYFTSAFPTLFPYGTAKHRDLRRENKQLSLLKWVTLMLRHSSRFVSWIISSNY